MFSLFEHESTERLPFLFIVHSNREVDMVSLTCATISVRAMHTVKERQALMSLLNC